MQFRRNIWMQTLTYIFASRVSSSKTIPPEIGKKKSLNL